VYARDEQDGQECLYLSVAEGLGDPDDAIVVSDGDERDGARGGECPPGSLLVVGVAPALVREQADHALEVLAVKPDDLGVWRH